MYNRYIPQSDGSYRRDRIPEKQPKQPASPSPPPASTRQLPVEHASAPQSQNIGGFLRRLLPKDFDTGDLIVVLLLLLMSEDCEEEKNSALLTLALYFFM